MLLLCLSGALFGCLLWRQGQSEQQSAAAYDIVTLVHHSDMDTITRYGLESFKKYFGQPQTKIYAFCTPQAYERLEKLRQMNTKLKNVLVPVLETIYPFTLDKVGKFAWNNKTTWIFQQLLKLYTYRSLSKEYPNFKQNFLVIDSDTVAVQPTKFFVNHDMPIFTIGSTLTGSFTNDCTVGLDLVPEVFGPSIRKALPTIFTAIAHHMMFNGKILNEMLAFIEAMHENIPAWMVLSKLQHNLSEWELYMAWMMKHHRGEFVLRQTPYINWGLVNDENLEWLREHTDISYLTDHDEMGENEHCCINSSWRNPSKVGAIWDASKYQDPNFSCLCCEEPNRTCVPFTIDYSVLGLEGCRQSDRLI